MGIIYETLPKKLAKLLFDWIAGIGMQYSVEQKEGAVVI